VNAADGLLHDRVVVVSGVGPGLGRSIAVQCARAGADVVLAARTEKRLDVVAEEVVALGRRAHVVPTDVTDEASAGHLVDVTLEAFGRADVLVNNAFAMPPMQDLADTDLEALRAGFEVNVLAALRLTRLFAPALADTSGSVVMVNSAVLRHSRRPYGPYKMAKAGLLAMGQLRRPRLDLGRDAAVVLRPPGRAARRARAAGVRRDGRDPRPAPPAGAGRGRGRDRLPGLAAGAGRHRPVRRRQRRRVPPLNGEPPAPGRGGA
jgi:NAD(P)-dependent dehydrogenase (short-subunit alcohol dehydrogenase family)